MGMRIAKTVTATMVAGVLVLTGCSSGSDSGTEEMVENLLESGTGNEVEIGEDSLSMTDDQGGGFAAGDEAELPPAFPADVPLFTYGTLVAAAVMPGEGFTATWRMETPDDALVESYISEWENLGFTRGGFLDMSTDGTRVWTYQMTNDELEVAVTATIADGDETEDSLVSMSGRYLE